MDLKDYIDKNYAGVKTRFAADCNVLPQQVTKWLERNCIVINGIIYTPKRMINYSNGGNLNPNENHKIYFMIQALKYLKKPISSCVPEYRSLMQKIVIDYQFESRLEKLKKVIEKGPENIDPLLESLDYHSKSVSIDLVMEEKEENTLLLTIKCKYNDVYIQDLYRDIFIYYLRHNEFNSWAVK